MQNPIICAVDTTDIAAAKTLAAQVRGHVGSLKLGLEFFTAHGAAGVSQIASPEFPVFLDLKFHDIPHTVAKAIKATAAIDTFLMTIHTAGGKAMMQAAAEAVSENAAKTGKARPMVVGVTILTSLDQNDLSSIGVSLQVSDQVVRLAELAQASRLDGVVCSPHEIEAIKRACGKDFKLIVPGIRPAGSEAADQKRVLTPKEAMDRGADYLVIGRPITGSTSPAQAAKEIFASLK